MSIFNFLLKSDLNTRELRININDLNAIGLHIKDKGRIFTYTVQNISSKGLAFDRSADGIEFNENDVFNAKIEFKNSFYQLRLRVVHLSPTLIGCQVIEDIEEYKKVIRDYFSAEISALTINQVGPENLKPDPDGTPFWFQSNQNNELFFVVGVDGLIKKFHLVVFGHSIIFDGQGIYLGTVWNEEPVDKMSYKKSDLILTTETIPASIKDYSIRFVEYLENMKGSHKRFIISHLKSLS
jgi:hypothetical protein